MRACFLCMGVSGIIFLIIGGSLLLLGSYLPNRLFNERVQEKKCRVFYTISFVSQTCYDVVKNIKPDGATCWQAPTIATFVNETEAKKYASTFIPFTYTCYWDPDHICNYYDAHANVEVSLWIGIVSILLVLIFLVVVSIFVCYTR